jgi:membrane protease YdiL (CAAX protease family)
MTDIAGSPSQAGRTKARAVVVGLLVAVLGVAPWAVIAPLNARIHPELPWAAAVTLGYLTVLVLWLNGVGLPRATRESRRFNLRLWRPEPGTWSGDTRVQLIGLMFAIAGLYLMWIIASPGQRITDLSGYPTPAYRVSVLLMGAIVSGVVEEVAFRGYMQSQLERFGSTQAIMLTSVVFVFAHITHGVAALLVMAPGYFIASWLYGLLAFRSGSILPGIGLHVVGDALYAFIVLLGGDVTLLTS